MRYAIISDIHSNIQALNKAFERIEEDNVDKIICLGDIVGYNAKPTECIEAVRSHPKMSVIIQGNHDHSSTLSQLYWSGLSKDAVDGLKHSSSVLSDEHKEWLRLLPKQELIEDKDMPFWISHHSPNFCTMFGYILDKRDAMVSVVTLKEIGKSNLFFFGHTHYPSFIEEIKGKLMFDMGRHLESDTYMINSDSYYLINPGSIGQPRSGITSYAIVDSKERTVGIRGFEYDFTLAQKDVDEARYSLSIGKRLDPTYDPYKAGKLAKKQRCKKAQQRH